MKRAPQRDGRALPSERRVRLEAALAELRAEYEASLPTQLAALASAMERAASDAGALREAITLAHQLYGTGGSMGLAAVSEAARRLERALEAIDPGAPDAVDEARQAAQRMLAELVSVVTTPGSTAPPSR